MRVVSTAPRRPTVTGTDLLNLAGARPRTSRRAYYLNNVSDNHYFKACRQPLHPSQRPYLKHESSTATCTRSNAQPFTCWPIRRPTYAIRDYDRCHPIPDRFGMSHLRPTPSTYSASARCVRTCSAAAALDGFSGHCGGGELAGRHSRQPGTTTRPLRRIGALN